MIPKQVSLYSETIPTKFKHVSVIGTQGKVTPCVLRLDTYPLGGKQPETEVRELPNWSEAKSPRKTGPQRPGTAATSQDPAPAPAPAAAAVQQPTPGTSTGGATAQGRANKGKGKKTKKRTQSDPDPDPEDPVPKRRRSERVKQKEEEALRQQLEDERKEEQNYLNHTWMWIDDDWYTKGFGDHFIEPVDLRDTKDELSRRAVAFRRVALRTLIEVCKYIRLVNLFFPYLPRVFLENWDNFCASKLDLQLSDRS